MYKNDEYGRTLMEAIMYISIFIMLILGAVKVAQNVLDKMKLSRVGEQVVELSKNISSRYMAKGRYDDIAKEGTLKILADEKMIPQDMVQNNNLFTHAYGGEAVIEGFRTTYKITFYNVPLKPCVELGLLNWTMNDRTNLVSVKINTHNYIWSDRKATGSNRNLPVKVNDLGNSCKDGKNNTIVWEFE